MTTRIIGTGSYTSEDVMTNDDLARIVETSDEWISSRTGIKERRLTKEGTTSMAVMAAKAACKNAKVDPKEIDVIILATTTGDYYFPSGACEVQKGIGAVHSIAFDLSAACSGFVFALSTIHAYFQLGIYKTGLIIGAESMSKLVDWNDRRTCVLFGDGAGAVVVRSTEKGIFKMDLGADGSKGHVLACRNRGIHNIIHNEEEDSHFIEMDGQEVFKFAVKKIPESIEILLKRSEVLKEDIKYYILHQANERILQSISKRMEEPIDKFPMNLNKYGNTSAASIPILLDEMNRDGKLKIGDRLILSGFGGGLTWGTILMDW